MYCCSARLKMIMCLSCVDGYAEKANALSRGSQAELVVLLGISVTYCCVTSHPKLRGVKRPHHSGICGLGIRTGYSDDGLFLLHGVWGLSWKDSDGWQ